jgi:hypothetical protein
VKIKIIRIAMMMKMKKVKNKKIKIAMMTKKVKNKKIKIAMKMRKLNLSKIILTKNNKNSINNNYNKIIKVINLRI